MLINNININTFKAKLLDRNIESADFNITNEWLDKSMTPYINNQVTYKYKTLTFTLDIICSNDNELEIMKSNLVKELTKATVKFDDIEYFYKGFINGVPKSSYVMRGNETLSITMLVISEKAEVTEVINRTVTKTINVSGNELSPCIVEIIPISDIIDIKLEGFSDDPIIIKNLKANKALVLDGENQTITVDGENKFGDTDMWEFPRLKPGENTFKFSRNSCDIKVRYKPRWI